MNADCSSTICGKAVLTSEVLLHFVKKSTGHICVGLFHRFSLLLCALLSVSTPCQYSTLLISYRESIEIWLTDSFYFFFFETVLAIFVSLP